MITNKTVRKYQHSRLTGTGFRQSGAAIVLPSLKYKNIIK
jgi:hypothetical protein